MRRLRFGSVLAAAALATATVVPLLAAPAGAANSCDAGEFPATFAAQSGLKVTCSTDAGVNVNHIEIHDADNVAWHHGAAHSVALTPAAPNKATTAASTTVKFTAGKIQTRDLRRPISGFVGTASVFKGGTFITAVSPANCTTTCTSATISQSAALTEASVTAKIENTNDRYLIDAFCTAETPTTSTTAASSTVSASSTTVGAGSNGKTIAQILSAHSLATATNGTANFQPKGTIKVVDKTSGGVASSNTLTYTSTGASNFVISAVTGTTTNKVATGGAITWLTSNVTTIGPTLRVASNVNFPTRGTVSLKTSALTLASLSYTGKSSTTALTGVAFVSGSGTFAPAAAVAWTGTNVTTLSGDTLPVIAATANNGFTAPNAGFVSPLTVVTTAGTTAMLSFTGSTSTSFTGVSFVSGSGLLKPNFALTGAGATASAKLSSASAHFVATDIGKSVSGGAFPAGTVITAVPSATTATLSNAPDADCSPNNGGNPGAPTPVAPLIGADQIEIGAATFSGGNPVVFDSDPMTVELSNTASGGQALTCSGSTLALTAAAKADMGGFNAGYLGLAARVDKVVSGVHTVVSSTITAVNTTGNTSATISPACPAGVTATNAAVAIGVLSAGAPTNNSPMMTLGAELNLSPALVAEQDNCSSRTFEGFMVVGGWENPGSTYAANASTPLASVGQVLFPTSVIAFDGFVVPKKSGDTVDANPHYNFSFPILPTSLAVCTNAAGTAPLDSTVLAFGMNPTTMSAAPFLPTGSGNVSDPTVRSLLPKTGSFSQRIELISNPSTVVGTFTSTACVISVDTAAPGFGCGDG